jgi:hypothetical protein
MKIVITIASYPTEPEEKHVKCFKKATIIDATDVSNPDAIDTAMHNAVTEFELVALNLRRSRWPNVGMNIVLPSETGCDGDEEA